MKTIQSLIEWLNRRFAMAKRYTIRYRKRARQELNACIACHDPAFANDVYSWLDELAEEAARNGSSVSSDAQTFLEKLAAPGVPPTPRTGLPRWLSEDVLNKLRAVLALLRDRCPPWQFRMAMNVFIVRNTQSPIPTQSPGVVTVLYEVDRGNKRVVVTIFPDLP